MQEFSYGVIDKTILFWGEREFSCVCCRCSENMDQETLTIRSQGEP